MIKLSIFYFFILFPFIMHMKKNVNKKGFTVIELVVIVVLIAVISVVAFVYFWNQALKARNSMRKDTVTKISMAVKLYKQDNLVYPEVWPDNVIYGYYDVDSETWSWYQSYSQGDVLMMKNSDFNKKVPWIQQYMSRITLDPASESLEWSWAVYYRYWVDYAWTCLSDAPNVETGKNSCNEAGHAWEKLMGTAFEVWTVLEKEDWTYQNLIYWDLAWQNYSFWTVQ